MVTMGERLKSSRKRFGWTQEDLAQESMVGLATVRRIEQHMDEPRLDTVRRLAGTLRVRPGWLAFGDELDCCTNSRAGGEADGDHDWQTCRALRAGLD